MTSDELVLPSAVSVSIAEIGGAVREGLLALAVAAGLQVMTAMMDESVAVLAGPKGRHQPDSTAVRHGSEAGSVVLGGRRVPVRRPRVRATDGTGELPVDAYDVFNRSDLLEEIALERMMAKLSTRRYSAGLEPVGEAVEVTVRSTSKSSVSRRFVARTEVELAQLMTADLSNLDIVALMIDGVHFAGHLCVVALRSNNAKLDTEHVVVRVVDYTVDDGVDRDNGPFWLFTTLLEPDEVTATDLAAAYAQRWEIESAIDEPKTHQCGTRTVLGSKVTSARVAGPWGHLCCHYAIRTLIFEAAHHAHVGPGQLRRRTPHQTPFALTSARFSRLRRLTTAGPTRWSCWPVASTPPGDTARTRISSNARCPAGTSNAPGPPTGPNPPDHPLSSN